MRHALLFLLAALACATAPAGEKPNILLIMGDDHAAYALGAYGSRLARTPHLDKLAAQGVVFDRAFCNSPVCTPSRQSLLTGRFPRAAGVTLLSTPLAETELTLPEHLSAHGYYTAGIGKMHFNSQFKHGFAKRVDKPDYAAERKKSPPEKIAGNISTYGPWRPFRDPAEVWLNAGALPQPVRETESEAAFFTRAATQVLQEPRAQPLFLMVSYYEPHSPFHFPVEYKDFFDPKLLPVPEVGPEDHSQMPLIFRGLSAAQKQGIQAAYLTSGAFLDNQVGALLRALEESPIARSTLVIYLSDHGYTLGHHGRFEKHSFYEEAIRPPLIVRWPGRIDPGQRRPQMIELMDLFPTISEAAGAPVPAQVQGKSFFHLLADNKKPHREHVVSQYAENEEAMVRTERWKLIYCSGRRARQDGYATDNPTPGRYVKLFDLESDPGEFKNLADDPRQAERIAGLKKLLLERFEQTSSPALKAPENLSLDDKLDFYVRPAELAGKQ